MIAVANQDLVELARKQVHAEEARTIRPYAPFRPYGVHLERHQQLLRNQELKLASRFDLKYHNHIGNINLAPGVSVLVGQINQGDGLNAE